MNQTLTPVNRQVRRICDRRGHIAKPANTHGGWFCVRCGVGLKRSPRVLLSASVWPGLDYYRSA